MFGVGGFEGSAALVQYRSITRPVGSKSWSSRRWVRWVADERLAPSVGPDEERVCRLCYGAVAVGRDGTPYAYCLPCLRYRDALDGLVPIAYSAPSGLESALHRYKDFRGYRWLATPLAVLLHQFLKRHSSCIQGRFGPIDIMTVVPSHPSTRDGWDAMKNMIGAIQARWPWPWDLDLLVRTSPATPVRRRISPRLFRVAAGRTVKDRRIVLVDDTFTSGRTIASAASALKAEGAATVVGVTLGRQLGTDWRPAAHLLASLASRELNLARCVLDP